MAAYTETYTTAGQTISSLLALSYKTLEQLGWKAKFAGPIRVIGFTPRSWRTDGSSILIEASEEGITVTSSDATSAGWNYTRKNKKNTAKFLDAFAAVKNGTTLPTIEEWEEKLKLLQDQTDVAIEEEEKADEEVEKVMNLSKGSKTVTYSIMGINAIVFIAMIISGVGIFTPESEELIRWGANYSPFTLSGEWWRLITCVFIHIGIIHLLFNMYAFYTVGNYLEPMLGKAKYIAAYLSTGVFASLLSLWWHKEQSVSAGASGAIFGLYGLFLALLTTNIIPKEVRKGLLQSIGIFVFYNLAYGMKAGVDNAAHLGGLLSGLLIGYVYYLGLKNPTPQRKNMATAFVLAAAVIVTLFFLKNNKDETMAYRSSLEEFDRLQEKAIKPMSDTVSSSTLARLKDLQKISLPAWQQSKDLMNKTKEFKLSEVFAKQRSLLLTYVDLRIKETNLLIEINNGKPEANDDLQQTQKLLELNIAEMNALFKA